MKLVHRLKSERGATFILALLLFAVSMTVGSVILAAASASSGRVAGLAKMDQRYYSVTSAVELFQDCLGDGYADAVQTRQVIATTDAPVDVLGGENEVIMDPVSEERFSYRYNNDVSDSSIASPRVLDSNGIALDSASSILSYLTCKLVFGDAKPPEQGSKNSWEKQDQGVQETTFTLSLTGQNFNTESSDLAVTVSGTVNTEGTAVLTFSNSIDGANAADHEGKDVYEIRMVLESDYESYTEESDAYETAQSENNKETRVTTYTESLHTVVSWHVADVYVV